MLTPRDFKALVLLSASLLFFHPHARAQSGRRVSVTRPAPAPTPVDYTRREQVRVVVSRGLGEFVRALNEQGRLGYRLEKTAGYGGPEPQGYAAVLRLDPGHTYEFASDPLSEDARFITPLNHYPGRGYTLAHAYAAVQCRAVEVYDYADTSGSPAKQEVRAEKGNVLLFMRRDGAARQTKEYRVFKGYVAADSGQKKELQAALDAAPRGFRPVRVLFSGAGPISFSVAILAERDLDEAAPPKVEYELVKEVFGFEDEVNRLAAAGSRYVVGGRLGFIKIALLERRAGEATAYTFKDDHQHRREFPRMSAEGNSYAGLLSGDLNCDPGGRHNFQKLVFERDAGRAPAREYKVLEIPGRGPDKKMLNGLLPDASVSELQSLLAGGFRVRDLVYVNGLYAILEKQAQPAAAQDSSASR